jgi:hypothetical protein
MRLVAAGGAAGSRVDEGGEIAVVSAVRERARRRGQPARSALRLRPHVVCRRFL